MDKLTMQISMVLLGSGVTDPTIILPPQVGDDRSSSLPYEGLSKMEGDGTRKRVEENHLLGRSVGKKEKVHWATQEPNKMRHKAETSNPKVHVQREGLPSYKRII